MNEETITNAAPSNVFIVGISSQNKYPNSIPKTNAKYFNGVTKVTSENLYDCVNHKFARPPKIPTIDNRKKSFKLGNIQPWGKVNKLIIVIEKEK